MGFVVLPIASAGKGGGVFMVWFEVDGLGLDVINSMSRFWELEIGTFLWFFNRLLWGDSAINNSISAINLKNLSR